MRLSVFTAMMVEGRVFDGSGRKLPPYDCIEKIAGSGFEGIEWGIDDSYALSPAAAERESEQLDRLSRQRGLETVAISSGASVENLDDVRRMLDITASLHAPVLRVGLRRYDPALPYDEQVKRSAEQFGRALEVSRPYHLKLLLEIHFGFLCPSPSLMQRFLAPFPPSDAGAIYDPGNMIVEGRENWKLGLEVLGDYLAHVHVKNIQWVWTDLDSKEHPTKQKHWQWQLASLDQGMVNWEEVISALRVVGYQGWLSLEDFSTRPLGEKLTEGVAFLSRLLENHDRSGS